MERRALLAIVLSVAILLAWQTLFSPPTPPPDGREPAGPPAGPSQPTVPVAPPSAPPTTGVVPLPRATSAPGPVGTGPVAEVATPLYRATFAPDGTVTAWELHYRGSKPLVVGGPLRPLAVGVSRAKQPPEFIALRPQGERVTLGPQQPTGELTFVGTTADGLRVEKRLRFRADSYRVETELRVQGRAATPPTLFLYWTSPVALKAVIGTVDSVSADSLVLLVGKEKKEWRFTLDKDTTITKGGKAAKPGDLAPQQTVTVMYVETDREMHAESVAAEATGEAHWLTHGETKDRRQLLGRILVARNGKPEAFEPPPPALKDPKESPRGPELKDPNLVPVTEVPDRRWVALENDYFIAALIPAGGARVLRGRERDVAEAGLVFPEIRLEPGKAWEGQGHLYVGPKEWDPLAALNVGLEQAQARNYGCFPLPCDYGGPLPMEWVCYPLLWLMNVFATRLPGQNYGVAIILLTVLVKIAFYPLTQKSMSSMKQMQALQPQLNALRAKYKSDPQRFQREQLELFRKHKVNPMGGCLPMVVQIPIFYALYLTLQYSVELQGAPFVLWITDLSKKDPYYVLPILMGISMLVQQKMTPTVGDPRQARVMMIMPVIFTFMFLEFPTGLVLYWLVNNVLSIGQQYLIDRAAQRAKSTVAVEAKPDKEARKA